jgi:hypothetical protein
MLSRINFKTLPKIGRDVPPTSNRNGCKAFVADISRTCLRKNCERSVQASEELFTRNGVGLGTGAGQTCSTSNTPWPTYVVSLKLIHFRHRSCRRHHPTSSTPDKRAYPTCEVLVRDFSGYAANQELVRDKPLLDMWFESRNDIGNGKNSRLRIQ